MITCKLSGREISSEGAQSPIIILDAKWLSLVLTPLVNPGPGFVSEGRRGYLLEENLFQHWMEQGRMPNKEACRCLLLSLSDLRIICEESEEGEEGKRIICCPHILSSLIPRPLIHVVERCSNYPHAGWFAKSFQSGSPDERKSDNRKFRIQL